MQRMNTPDKHNDARDTLLSDTPTITELMAELTMASATTPTPDEAAKFVIDFNAGHAPKLAGDTITVTSTQQIHASVEGLQTVDDVRAFSGKFIGAAVIPAGVLAQSVGDPVEATHKLAIGIDRGEATFSTGFTTGNFRLSSYFPLDSIIDILSVPEMRRLVRSGDMPDQEELLAHLEQIIASARRLNDGIPTFAPSGNLTMDRLSQLERWDFRGPRTSVDKLRALYLTGFASQGKAFFTESSTGMAHYIDVKDITFHGCFWAIASLNWHYVSKKPNAVFEIYATDNVQLAELAQEDPNKMKPLLYVPLSESVHCEFEINELA